MYRYYDVDFRLKFLIFDADYNNSNNNFTYDDKILCQYIIMYYATTSGEAEVVAYVVLVRDIKTYLLDGFDFNF